MNFSILNSHWAETQARGPHAQCMLSLHGPAIEPSRPGWRGPHALAGPRVRPRPTGRGDPQGNAPTRDQSARWHDSGAWFTREALAVA
jgi:hypothetical protein